MEFNYNCELGDRIISYNDEGSVVMARLTCMDSYNYNKIIYYLKVYKNPGFLSETQIENWLNNPRYLDIEVLSNISDFYGKHYSWTEESTIKGCIFKDEL